jgi:hypothetical protein
MMVYKELFAPYTGDGHTIGATFKYLHKLAVEKEISLEVMEMAINDVFSQVQHGKVFSKDHCPCGCGIDKAATGLIHAIRSKMFALDKEVTAEVERVMNDRWNVIIEAEMKRIYKSDKQYVKDSKPEKNGKFKSVLLAMLIVDSALYYMPTQ